MRQNSSSNSNKNRMRGRGRKPGNALNRNYESNGPDVKIRGNANHIAEKYQNLARDALSNGDTVMAENYFQHAEHYNRIVAAAQQNNAQQNQQNKGDDNPAPNGRGPQPEIEGIPAEVAYGENAEASSGPKSKSGDDERGSENKPRRNPRARRNQEASKAENEANGAAHGDEQEADQQEVAAKPVGRTRRTRAPKKDEISEDAADLPESLIAAPTSSSKETATVSDD